MLDFILMHIRNVIGDVCQSTPGVCQSVNAFYQKNFLWIQNQINSNPNDPYWYQVEFNRALFNKIKI